MCFVYSELNFRSIDVTAGVVTLDNKISHFFFHSKTHTFYAYLCEVSLTYDHLHVMWSWLKFAPYLKAEKEEEEMISEMGCFLWKKH